MTLLRHKGTGQIEDWAPDFAELLLANGLGERLEPEVPKAAPTVKAAEPAPVALTPVVVEVAAIDKTELIISDIRPIETAAMRPAQHAAIINTPRFKRGPKAPQTASR